MAAAKRADAAELRRLLGVETSLARARDAGGRSALHHLASGEAGGDAAARSLECLAVLRAHDADLDAVNEKTGLTPLHRAVMSGNVAFALALVDAGADASATSARERRSPPELCRDESFRAELQSRAYGVKTARVKAASASAATSSPAAHAAGVASALPRRSSGEERRPPALSVAAFSEGGAATGAFSGATAPPPEPAWFASPPPPSPASPLPVSVCPPPTPSTADAADDARPGKLRRTLVVPEAAAAAALADAWWRVAGALPVAGGPAMERAPPTLRLAFRGVPPGARAAVWRAASGAAALQAALQAHGVSYRTLVAAAETNLPHATSEQIDKDIRRTGVSFGAGGAAGTAAAQLRRVLRGLAALDPLVGYCQSLNSVAAMALLVLGGETDAFFLTLAVCRSLQPPGYYSGDLCSARADASLVAAALCRKHPQLRARLGGEDCAGAMLAAFVLPWLMTAFVGTVPLELALRVWDATLITGQEAMLRVAFALLDGVAAAATSARDEAAAAGVLATAAGFATSSSAAMDAAMERARDMRWPPWDAEAPGARQHLPAPLAGALAGLEARVELAGGAAAVRAAAVAKGRQKAAAGARAARGAMASLRARLRRTGTDETSGDANQASPSDDDDDDGEDAAADVAEPPETPTPEAAAAAATVALATAAAPHVPAASPMLTSLRMHEPLRSGAPGAPEPLPAYLFEAAALASGGEAEEEGAEAAAEGEQEGDAAAAHGLLGSAARAGALSALRAFVDTSL
jgi:hypothetical protein